MFGDTATVVAAGGDRQFKVKGQLHNKAEGDEDDKLNLRLRICQPLGAFSLSSVICVGDTPVMQSDLALSCSVLLLLKICRPRSGMMRPLCDHLTLQECTQYSCIYDMVASLN